MNSSEKLRILLECRSVTPGTSCGIENFIYSLVRGWKRILPNDELFLNIPPGTRASYVAMLGNGITYLEDPVISSYRALSRRSKTVRCLVGCCRRINRRLAEIVEGPRAAWARQCEQGVDAVVYPFQRDRLLHWKKPQLLVMHDFYDFEMPMADPRLRSLEASNLTLARAIVTSWPGPFRSLHRFFPDRIDDSFMVPFTFDSPPLEAELRGPFEGRTLLYAASTASHKNHENLVRGLGFLKRRGHALVRVICTGAHEVKRLKTITRVAEMERVKDWIEFRGFLPYEEIRRLYRTVAGVVAPSRYEALSGAVLEGLQFGRPVACSRITSHVAFSELLGLQPRYFDPESPEEIAKAISDILENQQTYRRESMNARSVLSGITQAGTVRQYREILEWICDRAPKPTWHPYVSLNRTARCNTNRGCAVASAKFRE